MSSLLIPNSAITSEVQPIWIQSCPFQLPDIFLTLEFTINIKIMFKELMWNKLHFEICHDLFRNVCVCMCFWGVQSLCSTEKPVSIGTREAWYIEKPETSISEWETPIMEERQQTAFPYVFLYSLFSSSSFFCLNQKYKKVTSVLQLTSLGFPSPQALLISVKVAGSSVASERQSNPKRMF